MLFRSDDSHFLSRWKIRSLDIRLGRHHGLGNGPNSVPGFMKFLHQLGQEDPFLSGVLPTAVDDPERLLSTLDTNSEVQDLDYLAQRNEMLAELKGSVKGAVKWLVGRR